MGPLHETPDTVRRQQMPLTYHGMGLVSSYSLSGCTSRTSLRNTQPGTPRYQGAGNDLTAYQWYDSLILDSSRSGEMKFFCCDGLVPPLIVRQGNRHNKRG